MIFALRFSSGIVGLFVALALIGASTGPRETDRALEGLIGPVRQVTTVSGQSTTIAVYDREGKLLKTVRRVEPPRDEPDAQEQIQKLVYIHSKGKRVREMNVDPDGQQYLSRRYAYDRAGRKRAEAVYHMCGTFSSLQVWSYDEQGRLREDLFYQYRSLVKHLYDYDRRGTLRTRTAYRNGVLQSIARMTFDQAGRVSRQVEELPDGAVSTKTSYEYDERGNPILEEREGASASEKTVSTYEYDSTENWTRRTTTKFANVGLEDGKRPPDISEITERTIVYY